jgi:hypothetical protein
MSTKSTIVLTEDNEHIYYEDTDNTIVIEISKENMVLDESDLNPDNFYITIKDGTHLAECIQTMRDKRRKEGLVIDFDEFLKNMNK